MKNICLFLLFSMATYVHGQVLDNSFNGTGIVKTDFTNYPNSMGILPNGKIVVASHDYEHSISLIRYKSDGSLDQLFGTGGVASYNITQGEINGSVYLKVLPDGSMYVGSYYYVEMTPMARLFVARFNEDGSIDGAFGTNGIAINDTNVFDFGSGCANSLGEEYATYNGGMIEVDYAGRILQVGTRTFQCDQEFEEQLYAVRYLADGTKDTSFAFAPSGGPATFYDVVATGIHVRPDSIIILTAHGRGWGSDTDRVVPKLMPLQPNGTNNFGEFAFSLKVRDASIEYFTLASIVAIDSGYLLAGTIKENNTEKFAITKVKSGISNQPPYLWVDSTYGTNGRAVIEVGTLGATLTSAIAIPNGKLLLGGTSAANGITDMDMTLVRLNADGSLDQTFGSAGILRQDHDSGYDELLGMQVDNSGKLVVMGGSYKSAESYTIVMRYADGLTSINEARHIHANAYPNPTEGKFTLSFGEPVSGVITLSNVHGSIIEERRITEATEAEFSLLDLSKGVYMAKFAGANAHYIGRIVKE